jgi:hypothetical protein
MPFSGTAAAIRKKEDCATSPNLYTTSILVLQSAVLKLAAITPVPATRKVYRGFGRKLDSEWFEPNKRGVICGAELAFMSTTKNMEIALDYSGVNNLEVGSMFEFDVGGVDCGAQLDTLSQYPGTHARQAQGIGKKLSRRNTVFAE